MAEWTSLAEQTVNPGESIVFTDNPVPCLRGFIRNRVGTGAFLMSGNIPDTSPPCCCAGSKSVEYDAAFGANLAIPTGGTVEPITVAFAVDGVTIPSSEMEVTPAAVSEYFNVSRVKGIPIYKGCCQTMTIINTSPQPILVQAATLVIKR